MCWTKLLENSNIFSASTGSRNQSCFKDFQQKHDQTSSISTTLLLFVFVFTQDFSPWPSHRTIEKTDRERDRGGEWYCTIAASVPVRRTGREEGSSTKAVWTERERERVLWITLPLPISTRLKCTRTGLCLRRARKPTPHTSYALHQSHYCTWHFSQDTLHLSMQD